MIIGSRGAFGKWRCDAANTSYPADPSVKFCLYFFRCGRSPNHEIPSLIWHQDPMGRESDIDGSAGSIAIFCSRETPERFRTTLADALAAAPSGSLIEVLVNGNPELSQ